ncbi:MAG: serine/threonine protein phosphatase, partial [Pseudomonas stutzeri]|nr:serine/threonine protein phosphatase [Stutzerimonas stutzeri]
LEMQPGDDVLRWAELVLDANPGLPTIVTTHDYLSVAGERLPYPLIDLARVDPDFHNSAEQLWQKLLRRHDQIFLVLCGHQHGQAWRVDPNLEGNPVYQVLADYQGRGQAALDAGRKRRVGIGDGWLRLMRFDFSRRPATVTVRT